MMKKVSIAPLLLCLLSGITSCSVENDLQTGKSKSIVGDAITITAGREDSSTRAVLNSENDKETFWEAADKLTIWVGDGSTFTNSNKSDNFKLISGEGRKAAQFRGNPIYTAEPTDETILTAVLDRDDDFVDCSDGTTATVDFSTQRYGTLESVLKYDAFYATTTWSERFFSFRHTMSFVRWTIHVPNITAATTCSIQLSADGLINKAKLDLSTGKLSSTNKGNIMLTDVSLDASGNAVLYVALFPGQTTSPMTAIVTLANGTKLIGNLGSNKSGFTLAVNKLNKASNTFYNANDLKYTFSVRGEKDGYGGFGNDYLFAMNTRTGNIWLVSYATVKSNSSVVFRIPWAVTQYQESTNNGKTWSAPSSDKPAWLVSFPESGEGCTSETSIGPAQVTSEYKSYGRERNDLLKNAPAKSNYDLSQGGETANCYVISAPGTYKIPLIYGNARNSDGSLNESSFKTSNTGDYILQHFVDADGNAIDQMNIKNVSAATKAAIVWSDIDRTSSDGPEYGILRNLDVDETNNFLTFTVSKQDICQGNTVVGIYNTEGEYLWSWHLWFAPASALNTITCTNAQGVKYKFAEEPLGLTKNGCVTQYPDHRKIRVTMAQSLSGKSTTLTINQMSETNWGTIKATRYEAGRKDAFPGYYYISYPYKSDMGAIVWDIISADPATKIKNPATRYGTWYVKNGHFFINTWSVNNTILGSNDTPVVKSVYDPCPPGFHVPSSNALTSLWNGFTSFHKDDRIVGGEKIDYMGYSFRTSQDSESTILFYYHDARHFESSDYLSANPARLNAWDCFSYYGISVYTDYDRRKSGGGRTDGIMGQEFNYVHPVKD